MFLVYFTAGQVIKMYDGKLQIMYSTFCTNSIMRVEFIWRSKDVEDTCIIMKDFNTYGAEVRWGANYSLKPLELIGCGSNVASFFSIGLLFTL